MRDFRLFQRIMALFFSLFLTLLSVSVSHADDNDNGANSRQELNQDMQRRVQQQVPSDSYSVSGDMLLAGPGPDDVAAHMALMAFGDPVKQVMDARFNGINASSTSENITLITHLATITASLAIFFTSLMLFAALMGGVIYTGKDGELLGKDWDHKLFPLRASWHTAFLIPWPGFGGLAGIQVVIIFLGLLGLGIGGVVFNSGVKFIGNGEQIVAYQSRDIIALSEKVMESAFCHAINKYYTDKYSGDASFEPYYIKVRGATVLRGMQFKVGSGGECGDYKIPYIPVENLPEEYRQARSEFTVDEMHSDVIKTELINHLKSGVLLNYFNTLVRIFETPSEASVAYRFAQMVETEGVVYRELTDSEMENSENARQAFYDSVASAVTPASNQNLKDKIKLLNETFVEEASRFGFAFFFKYYYELSSRQEVTSSAVSALLDVDDSYNVSWDIEYCNSWLPDWMSTCDAEEEIAVIQKRIERSFLDMYDKYNVLYSNALGAMVDGNTYSGSVIENYTFKIIQSITEIPRDVNPDPIVEIKWLGDTLTTAADAIFFFTARVKAAAYGAEKGTSMFLGINIGTSALSSFISSVVGKLWVGLLPLFGLAFAYAYIIPSIPVIFGYVAVFSFFIYWALAVYHSPFWYAMGVMPKGDGLMGRSNTGYSMAVNLLLMPAFMIIGYFTGMSLMKVFGWMVSISFFDAMADVNRAGGINDFSLSKFVGVLVVYGTVYTVLIWKCFGLIFEASNTLSQWMGTNTKTDFGESEAKSTTLTSAGVAGQKFGESAVHMKRDSDRQGKETNKEVINAGNQNAGGKQKDSTRDLERQIKSNH